MQHYLFIDRQLLLTADNRVPEADGSPDGALIFSLDDGIRCAAAISKGSEGLHPVDLRASYDLLPLTDYLRAGKAAELLYWQEHHRYCGKCGTELEPKTELCRWCPTCQTELWPQLSPAVIVLIHHGDEILLVRRQLLRTGGRLRGVRREP